MKHEDRVSFFKQLIGVVFATIMIAGNYLSADDDMVVEQRSLEDVEKLIRSGVPSGIPLSGVTPQAVDERALLIENKNLQNYIGMKIFAGYGIYDIKENNCKFVEKPGVSKNEYDVAFMRTKPFADHYYGITYDKKTYAECNALATHLGGYVFVPTSKEEANFAISSFVRSHINNVVPGSVWTGIYKNSCNDTEFKNKENGIQMFLPFKNDFDKVNCDPGKLNIILNDFGKLEYANAAERRYCLIEFDTSDIYRPIKICAPWWKIIREYKKPLSSLPWDELMLRNINQADIPINMTICTKYNQQGQDELNRDLPNRIVHCTTYYSRTKLPECVEKPEQDICFVNECKGYVENACKLKKEKVVGKGYIKGEVILDGKLTETKVKLDVKTREYECPPKPLSKKYCLEVSNVLIYPKECPGSQCDARRECILNNAGDDRAIDQCYQDYKCEKIYASRDFPPILDSNGNVIQMQGRCSDGTILTFDVNIQNKIGKKCVKYEVKKIVENYIERCTMDRPFEDKEVDMSLVESDPYERDPNCVRMDKVKDSQKIEEITVKVKTKGTMRHKITKVNFDRTTETILDVGSDQYTIYNAMYPFPKHNDPSHSTGHPNIQSVDVTVNLRCGPYGDRVPTEAWLNKLKRVFYDGPDDNHLSVDGNIMRVSTTPPLSSLPVDGSLYVEINTDSANIQTVDDCRNYPSEHGFAGDVADFTYKMISGAGTAACVIKLKRDERDQYLKSVAMVSNTAIGTDSEGIVYDFKQLPPNGECRDLAVCLDGRITNRQPCTISSGEDGVPDEYIEEIQNETGAQGSDPLNFPDTGGMCVPPIEESFNKNISFDSLRSIVIFEEYIDGGFGYYSNFNAFPVRSNEVTVKFNGVTKKLPIEPMTTIKDRMHFHGFYHHISYRSKSPSLLTFIIAGGAAGAAAYFLRPDVWTMLGVGGLVFVIVVLLLTRSKKMDQQISEYFIYKDIPNDRYPRAIHKLYNRFETRYSVEKDFEIESRMGAAYVIKPDRDLVQGYTRRIYFHQHTDTGKDKPGNTEKRLKEITKNKTNIWKCMGIDQEEIERFTVNDELSINYGHPKCKWYNPWCERAVPHFQEIITNKPGPHELVTTTMQTRIRGDSKLSDKDRMVKEVGTAYLGAVNTLIVLVPYSGDYIMEAYNKYGDLLSSRFIHKDSFIEGNQEGGLLYAQVNFAENMNLAPGITEGARKFACRHDRMVEWGGGVSGVFFESARTDASKYCQKSNDPYVYDQSMTKIVVRPANMDDGFEYNLTKPMPFPNRVWIATLGEKQVRHYRCYKDWIPCGDGNFQKDSE